MPEGVFSRRAVLAGTAAVATAGCIGSDEQEFRTELDESATVEDFVDELESHGIEVDSTKTMMGDLSLFYHMGSVGDPQLETVALAFVPYRGLVRNLLSFTALSTPTQRDGVGWIERTLAEDYATGEIDRSEYIAAVEENYESV